MGTNMNTKTGALKCIGLKKQKGDFLLNGIEFCVEAGYVVGVIGRNGSGKTTLTRLLMGSYMLDDGFVILNGVSISKDEKSYKKQLAYVLNETPFPVSMTPKECGMLYGSYYENFDYKKYRDLLNEYHVPEKKKIKTFSKGQQIRHQLAFSLSYNASLYIFDEPAANLDIEFRDEFYNIIRKITSDGSKTVIYVSHLVDELEQLADYILWVSDGRQKYFGTLEELRESYQITELSKSEVKDIQGIEIVGSRERQMHKEVLIKAFRKDLPENIMEYSRFASLKEIMYYVEKGE